MTDREMLIQIHGHVAHAHPSVDRSAAQVKDWLKDHFKASPSPERLALEERVRNLERIVTSKGYTLTEELEAIG